MASTHSLQGLMKWLTRDEWRARLLRLSPGIIVSSASDGWAVSGGLDRQRILIRGGSR